jgi:ribulose bisphosphate carboxylase small subunit
MPSHFDSSIENDHRRRIWFFPDKFWQATENMPKDEASELMAEVERCAEAGDLQALSKYPFVFVGDPYKKRKRAFAD